MKLAVSEHSKALLSERAGRSTADGHGVWLTDTLDGKDVKSLHLITHCFAFQLGFGPGMASRYASRERAGAGTTGQARPGQWALKLVLVCQGRVYCGLIDCELPTCFGLAASVSKQGHAAPGGEPDESCSVRRISVNT